MEFLLNYQLLQTSQFKSSYFSAAVNRFTFKDFIDGDNNYSGNKLTGVPDAQWNVGLDASSTSGFSLTTSFSKVGRIPMNQNSKYTETYL
jgi:iron complex outermembrane receptor protein